MQDKPFIHFVVPGYVIPKARARVVNGHAYTPKRTMIYEREIAVLGSLEMGGHELLECPVRIEVVASFTEPKAISKRLKGTLRGRPYMGRSDWDNIGKVACDSLNGIVYRDDRQVVEATVRKIYGDKSQLEISIWKA